MKIKHIVAMSINGCIGIDGELPWHLPSDLKWYKEQTLGKAVVVGSKTYDGLPPAALQGRTVYRASRSKPNFLSLENLQNLRSFESASTDLIIAGGAEIYAQTLHLADELLITEVFLEMEGDSYYPPFLESFRKDWQSEVLTETGIQFRFTRWIPLNVNQ